MAMIPTFGWLGVGFPRSALALMFVFGLFMAWIVLIGGALGSFAGFVGIWRLLHGSTLSYWAWYGIMIALGSHFGMVIYHL